ncbi:N-acetyltransferase [Euhalothece natronophila Z-M001]|uniref:N-acetyltransferase n=1 Tax=Euhalothece natronophila Z-M001 TaxID=522448 RepID=A0A5B8NR00_9CHRO|nr:N-acetyltransferase [Euhalothece natronophila Z-M001]
MEIRPEIPHDYLAVSKVHQLAFGQEAEANLVDQLRLVVNPYLSLVAIKQDQIIGHIFFTPVDLASELPMTTGVMGLAPMAVLSLYQRQGVGTALIREGLRLCQQMGSKAVVVLGHPEYYPRFGFKPSIEYGLYSEYDVPPEAFMAMELTPKGLDGKSGLVKYHPVFKQITE